MGLFDKKKNDLELHIVLNKGMIQDENRLIELFNAYCNKFHYEHQAYKEHLAIQLMTEALHNRFARIARIENMKMDLNRKEKEWEGKADICSYEDFFYIKSSKDPMIYKLNQNRTVYLEGYVYEIYKYNIGCLKIPEQVYFRLVPYPCTTEQEIEDLFFYGNQISIYVQIPSSLIRKIKEGDYVCVTGKIIKKTSDSGDFIALDLISIELPENETFKNVESEPEEPIDWNLFLSELEKDIL